MKTERINCAAQESLAAPEASVGIACGACGERADDYAGSIPFYLRSGSISTPLWRCRSCGTYIRDIDYDDPVIREHFSMASYTDPSTESHWRQLRVGLFKYVVELAEFHLVRPVRGARTLDLGTAFGILLELLRDAGARPEGIEIVASLREIARSRGLVIHQEIDSLPKNSYDLITAIDSFYYINAPCTVLMKLKELMVADGTLILRLTNRTWYFNGVRTLGMRIPAARYDDIKYNYSVEGAFKLLERSGFHVEAVYWADKGRGDLRSLAAAYYRLSPLLSQFFSLRVSPGMVIVAKPSRAS